MLHVPLPSVKGSQKSPQQASQSCASTDGRVSPSPQNVFWDQRHSPGACWKYRISGSFPDLLNQNLHLTRFPSDSVRVKICHTLVSKTVKKRALEKNISL